MGGVDKLDGLIALYRISFKNRKWYHRIFWHLIDICICNAWLVYRRDFDAKNRAYCTGKSQKHLSLMQFKLSISQVLRKCKKSWKSNAIRVRGRPKSSPKRIGAPQRFSGDMECPPMCVRTDEVGHWPTQSKTRGRCKMKGCKGYCLLFCIKCKVHLCIRKGKNCFMAYHGVDIESES